MDLFEGDELLALARVDLAEKRMEGALAKLKQAASSKSPPPAAFVELARVYAQLGLRDRAREFFERHLDAAPADTLARFQLGMVEFESGNAERALAIWDRVLAEDEVNPPALFYKALALARLNKKADAEQFLQNLLDSVDADNLYFSRGKKLLDALQSGRGVSASKEAPGNGAAEFVPEDAYKTEH